MNTSTIPREYLSQLTRDARLIRYLEDLGIDVAKNLPELINAAQLSADQALANANSANATALEALVNSLSEVQNSVNSVSSQVAELPKLIPEDSTGAVQSILAEIAELKKRIMKPKRIINASITVGIGLLSDTYTITPACDVNSTILNWGGQLISAALPLESALLAIDLTNSTTVTARRGVSAAFGSATVYFQIVEY